MEYTACKHLDYRPNYPSCELVELGSMFPGVKHWKRKEVPYEGAPIKVQFCKLRGRINDVFSCYLGEHSCYEPEEAAQGIGNTADNRASTKRRLTRGRGL